MGGAVSCPLLHTRSVCPISMTRLETNLAGVWLIRLLPDTDCRLQLSLNVQTVASQRKQENLIHLK